MSHSHSHPIIDIHTHIYPPSYLELLSSRTIPPLLYHPPPTPTGSSPSSPLPRLLILPSDAPSSNPSTPPSQLGRPLTPDYSSIPKILSFMHQHNIQTSILSLANPWLDFLPGSESAPWAERINSELASLSLSTSPAQKEEEEEEEEGEKEEGATLRKIYAFGTLPLSAPIPLIQREIAHITSSLPALRGVILGTSGLGGQQGQGLDDSALDPIWASLEESQLLVFVHPHYGLPNSLFFSSSSGGGEGGNKGDKGGGTGDSGHVLPLSLGFPMETTIAFVRMWLSGVFDRFPRLRVLLAHAGGAMCALVDRVQSCVEHERGFYDAGGVGAEGREGTGGRVRGPKRSLREVMRQNIYLDGVAYGPTGFRAAIEMVGIEKVMWGSDHPFFPPVGGEGGEEEWMSVRSNLDAVRTVLGDKDQVGIRKILGGNAVRVLGLDSLDGGGRG